MRIPTLLLALLLCAQAFAAPAPFPKAKRHQEKVFALGHVGAFHASCPRGFALFSFDLTADRKYYCGSWHGHYQLTESGVEIVSWLVTADRPRREILYFDRHTGKGHYETTNGIEPMVVRQGARPQE